MPGHIMPTSEIERHMLQAMLPGVAAAQQDVKDAATYLAPKLSDELAATIEAEPTRIVGRTVRGRVRTTEPYAIWQETKDWYKHRTGRSRYMANGLLMSVPKIAERVRDAMAGLS